MEEFDLNHLMRPKKICLCNQVSKDDIVDCIQNGGARSVEDISRNTQAGTNCGTCKRTIQTILESELEKIRKKV